MQLADFDYQLPPELIAQHPLAQRSASRLLIVPDTADLIDGQLPDLLNWLAPGDVCVFNDTRVIPARLLGQKASGGKIEALVERVLDEHTVLAHIRASHAPQPGSRLTFAERWHATMEARDGELFRLRFLDDTPVLELLDQAGQLPLPPYIERTPDPADLERYQTVFAREPGAVAAPTAGLHFDDALLQALDQRGVIRAQVTLHVGAGTFQPVRCERLEDHRMHAERYHIPEATAQAINQARAQGKRVLAVGTTSLRALESAALESEALESEALESVALESGDLAFAASAPRHPHTPLRAMAGDTRLFITPGFRFRVVDRLLTNFHLPKSTLLMLVSAFAGTSVIRHAYQHAIAQRYRFFSYGDAMLLHRHDDAAASPAQEARPWA